MLDLSKYESLGAALREAINRFSNETCLIEADRERENCRLTYRDFGERAIPIVRRLQANGFQGGGRAAIIMTNQSRWLIAAYSIFYSGGVLVPLDYKLGPEDQLALLLHSKAEALFTEHHIYQALAALKDFSKLNLKTVVVTDAPPKAELTGAERWEEAQSIQGDAVAHFVERQRSDWASIVYSSGTGGRPKGCVLTHNNYLEQCVALTSLYPFWPGVRYLSILPTNHAIDFMVGFIGPFVCGATVVHLRTLRPEFVREAFPRYKITYMALVPTVLKNLEIGLKKRFAELPAPRRFVFNTLVALNRSLTRKQPNLALSRRLLSQVHNAFGGELRALFVGGAFMNPETLQFFYDLGIQVANGYGLTEAGTAATLNDFNPFRADTVGKPLPGIEVRIVEPDREGIGQVSIRSKTVMSHYLDDAELTAQAIADGWLRTGDLGRFDGMGHLQLFGRVTNMIVTEEGKNVYPEDIENAFAGIPVKEFCVFAANYIWPQRTMTGEKLILVLRLEDGETVTSDLVEELRASNAKLLNFKRASGYLLFDQDFPRTASMKIKRFALAEEIKNRFERETAIVDL